MLCGTFSLDEHCATLLVKAGLHDLLINILKGNVDRKIACGHVSQLSWSIKCTFLAQSGNHTLKHSYLAQNGSFCTSHSQMYILSSK